MLRSVEVNISRLGSGDEPPQPINPKMSTYLTEASDTLEYQSYDYSNKTIDLIGEEFIKKEEAANAVVSSTNSTMSTASLPSLTYTTTTIPTISSGEEAGGVLYYNLDELSRYMPPENFRETVN